MEIIIESFERWFNGNQLITGDTTNIVLGIILVVLFIVLIVMLTLISIQTLFWTRIGWFFEDVWHWLKTRRYMRWFYGPRYPLLACGLCFEEEDLSEKEIHEIMDMIYKGNPPKYEIKKNKNGRNFVELEKQKK